MAEYGEAGMLRLQAAHAPFYIGARVRINERYPYGENRLATVTGLPVQLSATYMPIRFDGAEGDVEYHKNYLDVVT